MERTVADRAAAIMTPWLFRLEAQVQTIGCQEEQIRALSDDLAANIAERDRLPASSASPQNLGSRTSDAEAAALHKTHPS